MGLFMLDSWHLESRNPKEKEGDEIVLTQVCLDDDEVVLTKFCLDLSDMPENPDDQPKWANYQNDLICSEQMTLPQMQSSFPNLGYFHLWCLLWAGIIRIAVRVGRRQRLYRFLQHSEFGINNQSVCAGRDEHRSGSSESKLVLSCSRFWIQALAPDFYFFCVIKSVMQLWERCFGNF